VGVALLLNVLDSGVCAQLRDDGAVCGLLAQAWNILGGYGGQFSFGHALFFGTGAYVQAIAQIDGGLNPWLAMPLGVLASAGVGVFVGALSFRYGLKGSYFALVTLAFAEVFRIVALSVPFTGAGVGLMVPLREGFGQPAVRLAPRLCPAGARARGAGAAGDLLAAPLALRRLPAGRARQRGRRARGRRRTRSGQARRHRAVGRLHGRGGAFYVQVFQYIDPASPTARTPRWRRWSAPSWAAWARCGGR
jgi:branched-chain amino acid transport system permease protein